MGIDRKGVGTMLSPLELEKADYKDGLLTEDEYRIEQLLIEAGFGSHHRLLIYRGCELSRPQTGRNTRLHNTRLHNAFCVSRLPITEEQENPALMADRLKAGFQLLTLRGDRG